VCDPDGRVVAWAGDPHRPIFSRSAMKPVQAAVSLAAIGDLELSERQVAVMCSSHNGEPVHVDAVASVLALAGLGFEALRCPPDLPLDQEAAIAVGERRREFHNCSGKHSGKLLACARAGWDPERYLDPDHPLQRRILSAVEAATGLSRVATGVDGCGAPVHAVTVAAMATAYARLARPDRMGDLAERAARCVRAMVAEPYLVAGRNRVETAVMKTDRGIAAKGGAEGLVCAAALRPGLGIAVKVADGAWRADAPALVETLRQLDLLGPGQLDELELHARPPVLGGGLPVGRLEPVFRLAFT